MTIDEIIKHYEQVLEDLKAYKEQSGDAISRKDIEECKELMTDINGVAVFAVKMSDIRVLPAVTPQPKMGHWIDTGSGQMCSRCGEIQYGYDNFRRFCASCGAKMEEVKE